MRARVVTLPQGHGTMVIGQCGRRCKPRLTELNRWPFGCLGAPMITWSAITSSRSGPVALIGGSVARIARIGQAHSWKRSI